MSYSTINDKFNLQSCNVVDILHELKDQYIEQFNDNDFEKLSFFYLADTDTIILNKDNKYHDFYTSLVENYLEFDESKRNILRERSPESINETLVHLDVIIDHRMKARAC